MVTYLYTRPRRRNLPYRLEPQRPLDVMEDLFANMVFVTLEPEVDDSWLPVSRNRD